MNAYRVALILCRAATTVLWWSAGLDLFAGLLSLMGNRLGWFPGVGFPTGLEGLLRPLGLSVSLGIVALVLGVTAPTLGAAMTGRAMLEGETISSRRGLDAQEKSLARAGAGLVLLGLGLATSLLFIATLFISYFFEPNSKLTGGFSLYVTVISFVPSALRVGVGFVLAFQSGLRRIVKS